MLKYIIGYCLIFYTVVFGKNVFASCDLSITGLTANQVVILDATTIQSNTVTKAINFNVENSGSSDCYYFVTINEGVSGDFNYNRRAKITFPLFGMFQSSNSDVISYQLYSQSVTSSNIIKSLNHATFNQNVLGPNHIQAGQTLSDSFLLHVPLQTLPSITAESYTDDLVFTLYQHPNTHVDLVNDCPTCLEESQQNLNFQFNITEYVTISFGSRYNSNTGYALLDFDELETNEQQSFEVYVGGRTGSGSSCSVKISSENGSKLAHENNDGISKIFNEINYQVHALSRLGAPNVSPSIDLSNSNTQVTLATSSVPFLCGNNNMGVMAVEVFVTIGDVNKKQSGIYRDTLTIEVTIGL
jgi:hypothetical protein